MKRLLSFGTGGGQTETEPVVAPVPLLEPPVDDPLVAYSQLCRRAGFDRVYFVLSFDCDTPEDAEAAAELDPWLRSLGIPTTYAVPGTEIQKGAAIYRRIADAGAEFINHGWQPHAEKRDDGLYHGITFYNEWTEEEVVADIRAGHRAVEAAVRRAPLGFRAPHFGYYQASAQREVIYRTARELGYRYCSGTLPEFGLRGGPVVDVGAMVELPLSGSRAEPLTILDSWNHYYERRVLEETYADLLTETIDFYLGHGLPAVLNYYVDPAHVVGTAPFRRAIQAVVSRGVPALGFPDLARMARV